MQKKSEIILTILIIMLLLNLPSTYKIASANSSNNYPYQPDDTEIINALEFLRNQQSEDGNIGGLSVSAWVAMVLAAADEDPHDWGNLVNYLEEKSTLLDPDKATDWERQTLALVACNENPRDFAGMDFVEKIQSFYDGTQIGSTANLYDDYFGILALISAGIDKNDSIIQNVKSYIISKQDSNGGWGDVDSTSAAIMALVSAGENSDSAVINNALSFLKTFQTNDGGFQSWGKTNTASTSWAVMAITASNGNPVGDEWKKNGNTPISYLLNLQQKDGSFNWAVNQSMNPEWMTSYALIALLGKCFPVKVYKSNVDENNPPNTPDRPSGPSLGNIGVSYTFYTYGTDPDDDKIQYRFDWDANGNHEYSDWTILKDSGSLCSLSHIWDTIGIYAVKVQIRDEHGLISPWSNGLVIHITNDEENNNEIETGYWSGLIRIEGKNDTVWEGTVTVSDTYVSAKNVDTGEIEEYYISYPSVLGAVDEAASIGGFSYVVEYWPSWDAFLVKTINGDSDWWHYWVDYELPMVGCGKYKLTDEDDEILWGYLESWEAHALKISVDKSEVKKDEEFTVSVFDETDNSVEGATVYVGANNTYTTNSEGNVTIKLSDKGSYDIYSEKDGFVRSEKENIEIKKDIEIIKPVNKALYIANFKIKENLKNTWIIGAIDIEVESTSDVEKVEFYINGELEHTDDERPFEYRLNKKSFFKKTTIMVKSYVRENISFKILKMLEKIKQLLEKNEFRMIFDVIKNFLDVFETQNLKLGDSDTKEIIIFNLFPRLH